MKSMIQLGFLATLMCGLVSISYLYADGVRFENKMILLAKKSNSKSKARKSKSSRSSSARSKKKAKSNKKRQVMQVHEKVYKGRKRNLDFEEVDILGKRDEAGGSILDQVGAEKKWDFIQPRLNWKDEMIESTAVLESSAD